MPPSPKTFTTRAEAATTIRRGFAKASRIESLPSDAELNTSLVCNEFSLEQRPFAKVLSLYGQGTGSLIVGGLCGFPIIVGNFHAQQRLFLLCFCAHPPPAAHHVRAEGAERFFLSHHGPLYQPS